MLGYQNVTLRNLRELRLLTAQRSARPRTTESVTFDNPPPSFAVVPNNVQAELVSGHRSTLDPEVRKHSSHLPRNLPETFQCIATVAPTRLRKTLDRKSTETPPQNLTLAQFGSRQCQLCAHPKRPPPLIPLHVPPGPGYPLSQRTVSPRRTGGIGTLAAGGAATSCSPGVFHCFPPSHTRPSNPPALLG